MAGGRVVERLGPAPQGPPSSRAGGAESEGEGWSWASPSTRDKRAGSSLWAGGGGAWGGPEPQAGERLGQSGRWAPRCWRPRRELQ